MVTTHSDACSKCARRNPIKFTVVPEEAWRTVVLNRWRVLWSLHSPPGSFSA